MYVVSTVLFIALILHSGSGLSIVPPYPFPYPPTPGCTRKSCNGLVLQDAASGLSIGECLLDYPRNSGSFWCYVNFNSPCRKYESNRQIQGSKLYYSYVPCLDTTGDILPAIESQATSMCSFVLTYFPNILKATLSYIQIWN